MAREKVPDLRNFPFLAVVSRKNEAGASSVCW